LWADDVADFVDAIADSLNDEGDDDGGGGGGGGRGPSSSMMKAPVHAHWQCRFVETPSMLM
jgi:hypothetical protein